MWFWSCVVCFIICICTTTSHCFFNEITQDDHLTLASSWSCVHCLVLSLSMSSQSTLIRTGVILKHVSNFTSVSSLQCHWGDQRVTVDANENSSASSLPCPSYLLLTSPSRLPGHLRCDMRDIRESGILPSRVVNEILQKLLTIWPSPCWKPRLALLQLRIFRHYAKRWKAFKDAEFN